MNRIKCINPKCRVSTRYTGILPKRKTCKSCGADFPIGLTEQGKHAKTGTNTGTKNKYVTKSMTWDVKMWNDFETLCEIWKSKKSSLNRSVYEILIIQNRKMIDEYKTNIIKEMK